MRNSDQREDALVAPAAGSSEGDATLTEFGRVVARWCHQHDIARGELATRAGISPSYLSRLVHGHRSPTRAILLALDTVLGTEGELERAASQAAELNGSPPARRNPTPAQLPPTRTLVGRERELAALQAAGPARGLAVLIDGPPGVGKTALAISHAHQLARCYPDGALWADLRGGRTEVAEVLGDFLHALGVAVPEGLEERVRAWRSVAWDKRLLVVLDNARSTEDIADLLPAGHGCAVLITSRYRLAGLLAHTGTQPLTLSPLERQHARELLRARIGPRCVSAPQEVERIAASCEDLPRALHLAAERMAMHQAVPLSELIADAADDRWALTEIGTTAETSMRVSLAEHYAALPAEHQRMWRVLGAHGGRMTAEQAGEALGTTPCHARQVLNGLVLAHVATRTHDGWHMPALLAAYGTDPTETELATAG